MRFLWCVALAGLLPFAVCRAQSPGESLVLSADTLRRVAADFGSAELQRDPAIAIRIKGLQALDDHINLIEGPTFRALFLDTAAEKSAAPVAIDKIGVYIDGNRQPLLALIIPGGSAQNGVYSVNGRPDSECGDYRLIVVYRSGATLRANGQPFRTAIGDCGYDVNG